MNRKFWFFALCLLIALPVHTVLASEADFYVVSVSPKEVSPGQMVTLDISLQNLGTQYASRVEASLDPSDTSPIDSVGAGKMQIKETQGALTYGGNVLQNEEVKLSYDIHVAPNASEGTHQVPLVLTWVDSASTSRSQTLYLGIRVKDKKAEFNIASASPLGVALGEVVTLDLTLKNLGTEAALNLRSSLDPDDASPINPIGPMELEIGKARVEPGEEVKLSYQISLKSDAVKGAYTVPLSLRWTDPSDVSQSQTVYLGMSVLEARPSLLSIKSLDPESLRPGERTVLTFTVVNNGNEDLSDLTFSWSSSVIQPVGGTNEVYIPGLGVSDEVEIPVDIVVNQTASSGIYPLTVSASYYDPKGSRRSSSFTSALNILRNPDQELGVRLSPISLNPGERSEVLFEISNLGSLTIKDISVVWSAENNVVLPVDSGNRITVASLRPGEGVSVPVLMVAGYRLGVHPVTIDVSYYDELDKLHSTSMSVGAVIGGGTNFGVSVQQRSGASVSFSVGNIGVNPATAVVVRVPLQDAYTVVGPFELFLGNLDPGDFSVASFQISPKGKAQKGGSLQVEISYTDSAGTRQTLSKDVSLIVSASGTWGSEMQAGGVGNMRRPGASDDSRSRFYLFVGVGGLLAIVGGYFLWKRFKRRRE